LHIIVTFVGTQQNSTGLTAEYASQAALFNPHISRHGSFGCANVR
jgi:hypothetical protein